jgi:hypothetical protein
LKWLWLGISIEADPAGIVIQQLSPVPGHFGTGLEFFIPLPVCFRHGHFSNFGTGINRCRKVRFSGNKKKECTKVEKEHHGLGK